MTFGRYAVDYEQRLYNPERMRKERLARAQASLKKFGLGAMLVYSFDSHRYLGYYSTHQYARRRPGLFVLLIRGAGFPYAPSDPYSPTADESLMPWYEGRLTLKTSRIGAIERVLSAAEWDQTAQEVKALLKKHDVFDLPCGFDMTSWDMIEACKRAGIKLVDGNRVMAAARIVKTEDEVECLRTAGSIVESAHWEVCKALRPGVTEWEMAGVASKALFTLGAEEMEGPSYVVCSGERVHHNPSMPTDKIVRPGDMFIIDINGVSFQGYRTCFYRTYVVGDKPTEYQKELYNCAYEGIQAFISSFKAGITTQEVNEAWKSKGRGKGKWGASHPKWPEPGRYYRGTAAHHIGLSSGDPGPGSFRAGFGDPFPLKLEKNMCYALEVGVFDWDGNKWSRDGAKIEDCGRITESGFEDFYRFPSKELIACGLPGKY